MLRFLSKIGPLPALGIQLAVLLISFQLYQEFYSPLILFLGAIASIVMLFVSYRIKNFLEAIPTSKVRSVAMGMAELKGEASGETKLTSPMTKTKCFAYHYLEQKRQRINNSNVWVTTKDDRKDGYFYIKDKTGELLCYTKGANLDLPGKTIHGFNTKRIETIVTQGTKLFVIGHIKDNPFVKDATSSEGYKDLMMGDGEIFIISNNSEKSLRKWYGVATVFSGLSAFGLIVLGFLI